MSEHTRLTPAERQAIRERCEKATPGPWRDVPDPYNAKKGWRSILNADRKAVVRSDSFDRTRGGEHWTESGVWMSDDNATFIISARKDVPRLLADLEDAEREITELREKRRLWALCHLGFVPPEREADEGEQRTRISVCNLDGTWREIEW